jgi:hypothetical protein
MAALAGSHFDEPGGLQPADHLGPGHHAIVNLSLGYVNAGAGTGRGGAPRTRRFDSGLGAALQQHEVVDLGYVNGTRAITADTALRLGKYFGVSPKIWLDLQSDYELRVARQTIWPEVEPSVKARVA